MKIQLFLVFLFAGQLVIDADSKTKRTTYPSPPTTEHDQVEYLIVLSHILDLVTQLPNFELVWKFAIINCNTKVHFMRSHNCSTFSSAVYRGFGELHIVPFLGAFQESTSYRFSIFSISGFFSGISRNVFHEALFLGRGLLHNAVYVTLTWEESFAYRSFRLLGRCHVLLSADLADRQTADQQTNNSSNSNKEFDIK